MGRAARVFTALGVAFAMLFVGTGVALAATVAATGIVTVQVQETGPDGIRVFVPVPALALDLGLGIATLAIPADELARLRAEAAPFQGALVIDVDADDGRVRVALPARTLTKVARFLGA